MVAAFAVAAIVVFGSVFSTQIALAAVDDGSASVTADIVLVAPGEGGGNADGSSGGSSNTAGYTRAASPVTGDQLVWLPLLIIAAAAAGVAVYSRGRSGRRRGAHARNRSLFTAFIAMALVGSAASLGPIANQAQADGNDQIVIQLEKNADGTLSGSTTYALVNDATYYRDLVKLTETTNAGYSLSDGSIVITVAPVTDEFSYVDSPDAVKGAPLLQRIPGSAVSDEHALKFKVSATAKSLDEGKHTVGMAAFDMTAPIYEGMVATLPSPVVGQPVAAGVSGLPSEATNALSYAWEASDDGEAWEAVPGTTAALTPMAELADKKLAVNVTCQNPAWFAVAPARGVAQSPVAPVYVVTFDVQGHGQAPADQTDLVAGSKVEKPADPSEVDWVFNGWYKDAACTEAWDFDADTVDADVTLYAKWVAVEYMRVVFDANDGMGSMDAIDAVAGTPVTLTPNEFTRTGYTFMGWNTESDGSGTSYADQTTRSDFAPGGSEVTLYAQWQGQPVNYTVNHYKRLADDSGYDTTPANTATYTGTAGTLTAAAAKNYASEGYVAAPFSQVTIAGDSSTVVDIYYDWMTYTVTYETWGQPVSKQQDDNVRHGTTVTAPASPVANTGDPKFIGWFTDPSFTTSFDFSTPITADTVVYAKYYPEVTVKFENGLAPDVVFPKALNSTFTEAEASGCTIAGYTITGFYSDAAFTQPLASGFSFTVDSDKTVYAKLKPRTDTSYTVKHLQQSLADATAYVEVTADRETLSGTTGAQTAAAAKTYDGFTAQAFSQATIAADGSTVVEVYYDRNTATPYTVEHYQQNLGDSNYTLVSGDTESKTGTTGAMTQAIAKSYAGYVALPFAQVAIAGDGTTVVKIYYDLLTYQVKFDLNGHGGITPPATQVVKHGGLASLPTPDPAEATWVFDGWFDAASGGTQYTFGTPVTADTNLYAHWSRQKFTVSFVIDTARGITPTPQSVDYGNTATNPGDPSNTGYTLVDWYEDSGYATVFNFATAVIKNTQVYGKIVPTYAVTYLENDGNTPTTVSNMPTAQTKVETVDLVLDSITPTRSPEVRARRTVTYNANGGSSTGVLNNQNTSDSNVTYTFDSWSTDAGGHGTKYDPGDTYSADAALTLYAQWTLGSTPFNAVTLPTPTHSKNNVAFMGWYTAEVGGTRVGGPGDEYVPSDNTTLYAHWSDAVIHFSLSGKASGVNETRTGTWDADFQQADTHSQHVLVSDGYTINNKGYEAPEGMGLIGWNTAEDGSGSWVLPGETIPANDPLLASGREITLYAQWSHLAGVSVQDLSGHADLYGGYMGDLWVSSEFQKDPTGVTREADKVLICRLIDKDYEENGTMTFMTECAMPVATVAYPGTEGTAKLQGWNRTGSEPNYMNNELNSSSASGDSLRSYLPSDLLSCVKKEGKNYLYYTSNDSNSATLGVSQDEFWAPSYVELTGAKSTYFDKENSTQYAYFKQVGVNGNNNANDPRLSRYGYTNTKQEIALTAGARGITVKYDTGTNRWYTRTLSEVRYNFSRGGQSYGVYWGVREVGANSNILYDAATAAPVFCFCL